MKRMWLPLLAVVSLVAVDCNESWPRARVLNVTPDLSSGSVISHLGG
jgi:hypothetical protein